MAMPGGYVPPSYPYDPAANPLPVGPGLPPRPAIPPAFGGDPTGCGSNVLFGMQYCSQLIEALHQTANALQQDIDYFQTMLNSGPYDPSCLQELGDLVANMRNELATLNTDQQMAALVALTLQSCQGRCDQSDAQQAANGAATILYNRGGGWWDDLTVAQNMVWDFAAILKGCQRVFTDYPVITPFAL